MTEQLGNSFPVGVHPETGLYHVDHMPMPDDPTRRAILEKQLSGQPLTMGESMRTGRDATLDTIGDYPVKPDHVYRAVDAAGLAAYEESGAVSGREGDAEFVEGENNAGVDWYLGGVALKYGDVVLEAPALADLFTPTGHAGTGMTKDPRVRHFKSSPLEKPVPMQHVTVYRKGPDGTYIKEGQQSA